MAPRYSIVAGDFAEDARADVSHFRVYLMLGRHTDKQGWCRLKQITIGERIGITRETVNRKLRDLVEWGYVERRKKDAAGRAYWYRTIMDRGAPPRDVDDDASDDVDPEAIPEVHSSGAANLNVTRASHSTCNSKVECDAKLTSGVSAADHTTCDRTRSHQNDLSLTTTTPTPPAGRSDFDHDGDGTAQRKADRALAELRGGHPRYQVVIDKLLTPLVAQRRFSADDHLAAMREICSRCATFPDAHVAKVLDLVLTAKVKTIKAQRVFEAIEAVRKGGLMLVVQRGSAEFAAWLRHFEDASPALARCMARQDRWQVPTHFPKKEAS